MFFEKPDIVPAFLKRTFTDRVRWVLTQAREEAVGLQHDYVGTEHILLGMVRDKEGILGAVLSEVGGDVARVEAAVLESVRRGRAPTPPGTLPYTSRAKKVLEFTMAEAREQGVPAIGDEHLLLGLIREEKGIAAEVLARQRLTLERAREVVRRVLSGEPGPLARFRVSIDDASDLPIYEQIVGQVQEAVATRRLRPGERLPTVRQMADDLEIAPGTVARAYGELERLGVVVTEGARGTRVAEHREAPLPEAERPETLVGLLRPVAVAAFHLGATAPELRGALEEAMRGIYREE